MSDIERKHPRKATMIGVILSTLLTGLVTEKKTFIFLLAALSASTLNNPPVLCSYCTL